MANKSLTLCTVVISRYDLLKKMFESVKYSTYPIDRIYVVDNGRNPHAIREAFSVFEKVLWTDILTPIQPMGLAESWNWMIRATNEERLLVADDVILQPYTIEKMVNTPGDFISSMWFGCFIIRDSCIREVGLFDEEISPGYLYFEDIDYAQRMRNVGVPITKVRGDVVHFGSASLNVVPREKWKEHHHDRFMIAKNNYLKKWGSIPDWAPKDWSDW